MPCGRLRRRGAREHQLEVAAADDVEILNRYVAVEPLLVDAGALGSFAERESARCPPSAEPYEGLLVRIANASLTSVDGCVSVADGSGTTLLGTTAALRRRRRPRSLPASGAAAVDVVGVGRTGFRCENSAGANQGAIEDVLECLLLIASKSRLLFKCRRGPCTT